VPREDAEQRQRAHHHREAVQEQHRHPLAEARLEQAVVDVVAVGVEERLAGEEPPRHRERRVQQRDPQHGHGHRHRHQDRRLGGACHRERRQHEPQEVAPGVAEEDLGRVPVVRQEAGSGARQGHREDERLLVPHDRGGDHHRERHEEGDPGGQAVHAVDEVEGVGHRHHPEHRDQGSEDGPEVHPAGKRQAHHADAEAQRPEEHRRGGLDAELGAGAHAAQVIGQPQREHHQRRQEDPADLRHHVGEDPRHHVVVEEERRQRRQERRHHGHAAEARHGAVVDLARRAGAVEEPEPPAERDHRRGEHRAGLRGGYK